MKKWLSAVTAVVLSMSLVGCATAADKTTKPATKATTTKNVTYPQLSTKVAKGERLVEMKTTMGTIQIKLFEKLAPKTVKNFIGLSKKGYYNGVTFHRVMNDFMIQGGDPEGTGMGGESIYGASFEDEFVPQLFNMRGALSMANAGPNTNGSQFFIVQAKKVPADLVKQMKEAKFADAVIKAYEKNGGTPWLDGKHTVFGQVVKGMDIVDKIAAVKVDEESSKPVKDVKIVSIKVLK